MPPSMDDEAEAEEEEEEEEDEDEETLQLKLAALQAKLKLKKLQRKKGKAAVPGRGPEVGGNITSTSARKENGPPTTRTHTFIGRPLLAKPLISTDVQVSVSPQRKFKIPEEALSPGRLLLGIDKGLKGKNMSLRRPPDERPGSEDPFRTTPISVTVSRKFGSTRNSTTSQLHETDRQAKSFSEKIAHTRKQDKAEKENAERLRKQRSTGFGIQQNDISNYRTAADRAESRQKKGDTCCTPEVGFSRDQVLQAAGKANGGFVRRSNIASSRQRSQERRGPPMDIWRNPNAESEPIPILRINSNVAKKRTQSASPSKKTATESPSETSTTTSDSLFEPFSSIHLSKRLLPHDLLTCTFTEKSILLLTDLLGSVKSPCFSLPENLEPDYVILAIIAEKSPPLTHKDNYRATKPSNTSSVSEAADSEQNTNGKYIKVTLTDLKWTLDLYLFSTAYTRFWKLTPGTVIALLNPSIMPPKPGQTDTSRFSLTLNSSDDTVLEIGTSRNLGWCKSVRKDGKKCGSWVDKRHTEFCEFHVDRVVERTRRGRMEVQGMSAPFAPGGRRGGRTGFFGGKKRGEKPGGRDDGLTREGGQYDRATAPRYFVGPSIPGSSAARLLDAEGGLERGGSKEERVRKRLAERERENEIARRLGEGGNGAGSEYLRLRNGESNPRANGAVEAQGAETVDAGSLGLLGNKAREVHLSPIKKRKGVTLGRGSERKKTRFVTEKGIREAGRESFGVPVPTAGQGDDDDDDDDDDALEVV